ncbi:uncharacterized protein B0I36DRAFT_322538 [Microdochium trichocladiopsis]|uniref:Uncharacterized protein n=1 Tax=Microdochium trichocladiopsis TaxID=1682393 RepID=A0A9P8Y8N8_9PEZI|nr:uncharacterized protein B0I36DRAFT_322538 [Microdochium trichocladiopsis]KAH7030824.1 hypothetical protein B0I36DRAFT_322538 [Microdochium trichocladiopsis]
MRDNKKDGRNGRIVLLATAVTGAWGLALQWSVSGGPSKPWKPGGRHSAKVIRQPGTTQRAAAPWWQIGPSFGLIW